MIYLLSYRTVTGTIQYGTIYYYGTAGSKKPGPSDFIFTFLCAFYSIYILIINTGMMP